MRNARITSKPLIVTNTYFEGEARGQACGQAKALRGHSKDKRTDCPLLTLGLVLDASGFVRRSQVFAGNVREHHTLAEMLDALDAPPCPRNCERLRRSGTVPRAVTPPSPRTRPRGSAVPMPFAGS